MLSDDVVSPRSLKTCLPCPLPLWGSNLRLLRLSVELPAAWINYKPAEIVQARRCTTRAIDCIMVL